MDIIEVTNNFVFILRDETISESNGLKIPDVGQKHPHKGIIFGVGELVQDSKIVNGVGKSALWHQGAGMEVEYEDKTYLVIEGERIIAVV